MKYPILIVALLSLIGTANSQTYSDDFESYSVDDYLDFNSDQWTTFSDLPGTTQDVQITNERANSGTNSVKFFNSGLALSQFVIMPFTENVMTTGALNVKMSMYVETSALLRYRGTPTVTGEEVLYIEFSQEGLGEVKNRKKDVILEFAYPQAEWFSFELDINFHANKWHLEIDGVCVGIFANDQNFLAALDFYPSNDESYFVDDFSYEYTGSGYEIQNDARTRLESNELYGFKGDAIQFTGELINGGEETIESATLLFEFDEEDFLFTLTDLDIENRASHVFSIEGDYRLRDKFFDASLEIISINGGDFTDEDLCNDNSYLRLRGSEPADLKNIVVEEGTARWCLGCPLGIVMSKYMVKKYKERFIPITIHISDPMAFSEYQENHAFDFIPSMHINRDTIIYPDVIENTFLDAIQEEALGYSIHGAKFDEDTRELRISLLVKSTGIITDDHRVNIVLTEDDVQGEGEFWSQINGFSGREDLIDCDGVNWKDLPAVVLAEDMKFQHVARAILSSYYGLENSFEQNLEHGDEKLFNFSYTVPESFNLEKMHIVSMLINPDGLINTGESTTVLEAIENGYMGLTSSSEIDFTNVVNVYPNPSTDYVSISINLTSNSEVQIQLLDASGHVVLANRYEGEAGYFLTNLDTSNIPSGNYIVSITSDDGVTAQKLTIVR